MNPIKGASYVTQNYGKTLYAQSPAGQKAYRNFPNGIHPGIDFGTHGVNLEVVATVAGKVVRASEDGGWGKHIELKGEDGWNRQYAHLSLIDCFIGSAVVIGQVLGRVGNTGASTGVHLHYGNRKRKLTGGWEYRNPTPDFGIAKLDVATVPKKKLIKGVSTPGVFVYNGKAKWGIPNWETKVFLFGEGTADIEEVSEDVISKIPTQGLIPNLE